MSIGRTLEGAAMLGKAEQISPEMKTAVQQIMARFR